MEDGTGVVVGILVEDGTGVVQWVVHQILGEDGIGVGW